MANLPLAFAEVLVGVVLVDAGIKGAKVGDVVRGVAQTNPIAGLAGGGSNSSIGPGGSSSTLKPSGTGGGFLPQGATYVPGRHDQGQDGQTNPGGPIIAPGNGIVERVGSDPSGFGPSYPIVKFTSGPYAGKEIYIGHTLSALKAGAKFTAGQILSYTGKTGIGNATTPGWFEIGYAAGGSPGPFGQPVPF